VAPATNATATAAAEARGAALASEISRLRDRLHPTTTPQQPARNLFQFNAAPAARAITGRAVTPENEAALLPPSAPPAVAAMTLIGIAEDPGPAGMIRTAIISGFGELFLARQGDAVTSRYRVANISSDVVELRDVDDSCAQREGGCTVRLALK
jgi:hypothetical protein